MNSLNESNCCRTNPFSSKKDEMTVQASSCDERVGIKERARCQRRAFHRIGIENKVGKREKARGKRKCGDRSSTRLCRAFTHPPRSQTAHAAIRDAPRPFAHHRAKHPSSPFAITRRAHRGSETTLEIRGREAHRDRSGNTERLFAKSFPRKRATKNTHLANLLVLLRDVVERHGSKINWRPVSLPLALARAKETRKWRPLLCAVRKGFK